MAVKKGDTIKIEYEGRFEDGTVFDSSSHGDHSHPLEFTAGIGMVVKGLDEAVIGMNEGDEKEITLRPSEAYGERREEFQQKVPRSMLPPEQEPKVGMAVMVGTPDGQQMPVRIVSVDEETITLDLNHPLAGKTLIFKIKLVSIEEGKSEEEQETSQKGESLEDMANENAKTKEDNSQ